MESSKGDYCEFIKFTSKPAKLTSKTVEFTSKPAKLTSKVAKLTSKAAEFTSKPAKLTGKLLTELPLIKFFEGYGK
ncbi:hypothetical protein P4502_23595 [Peribacillus frigoritolerans]|uniref:hypothetical protein n=1 Tax=Peribacillus frigoritolerans TaxID=450367 RepID=UPI000BAC52E8|nr:hypothetical protein [Peribacillus frigoritolerans]MED3712168.1 hypothetical protein [Peribacillus frigoritolerans]PAW30460.1 hypothetical protein BKC07_02545 [Peribacillus simplex]